MNEEQARKKIQDLKAFYGHLLTYAAFMVGLAITNFMTYRQGGGEIWVVYPLVFWGAVVLLQGLAVHWSLGRGRAWEEEKFRELTGWNATQEELARLSQRIETLLTIVSAGRDQALEPELDAIREQLLAARQTLERYRSPLDETEEGTLKKRDVTEMIERLEAFVTSRAFQHLDSTNPQGKPGPSS